MKHQICSTMYCKRLLFWFFVFDSEGNLKSFLKQEVAIHKHVVLQLANHGKQLNAFDRSMRGTAKALSLSTAFFNLSIIRKSQCGALKLFQKLHWNFEKILKLFESCLHMSFSNILEIIGRILIGL